MKFYKVDKIIDHPWNEAVSSFLKKYPNPLQPHVKDVYLLNREIDPIAETLKLRRLMILGYDVPGWVQKVSGISGQGLAVEEMTCNARTCEMKLRTQNISYAGTVLIDETCRYIPHPRYPRDATIMSQQASYTIKVPFFSSTLEEKAVEQALSTCGIGVAAVNSRILLDNMHENFKSIIGRQKDYFRKTISNPFVEITSRFKLPSIFSKIPT